MPSGIPFGVANPLTSNLDVGSFGIISSSDGNIPLVPNGTGVVDVQGTVQVASQILGGGVTSLEKGAIEVQPFTGTASPVILRESGGVGGMSLNASSGFSGFGLGVYWDGTDWIVLTAGAMLVYKSVTEGVIYGEAGLTPGDSWTPLMLSRLDLASGAQGFGLFSPERAVDIVRSSSSGNFNASGFPGVRALNKSIATHSFASIQVAADNGDTDFTLVTDGLGSGGVIGESGAYLGMASNHPLWFITNNTKRGGFLADGTFVFAGTAGLVVGEIYVFDANATHAILGTGIANKVQIVAFDTNGYSLNTTPDHTANHITITIAGQYLCVVSLAIDSLAGSAAQFGFGVFKNDGAVHFQNIHANRDLPSGAGGHSGSISMSGIIDLAISDTIEVWVWNETNTQNIVIDDITLTLTQVGGT